MRHDDMCLTDGGVVASMFYRICEFGPTPRYQSLNRAVSTSLQHTSCLTIRGIVPFQAFGYYLLDADIEWISRLHPG